MIGEFLLGTCFGCVWERCPCVLLEPAFRRKPELMSTPEVIQPPDRGTSTQAFDAPDSLLFSKN
jgi:hypothetical protein